MWFLREYHCESHLLEAVLSPSVVVNPSPEIPHCNIVLMLNSLLYFSFFFQNTDSFTKGEKVTNRYAYFVSQCGKDSTGGADNSLSQTIINT